MRRTNNNRLWRYLGHFILIHLLTYSIIAVVFLTIQNKLPAVNRVALEFYQPYRPLSFLVLLVQAVRGGVLALVLYPFYDRIVQAERGLLILFGALWGLVILCSIEPLPGSIEGLIYTETTLAEHIIVLGAGAVQVLLFACLFLRWERRTEAGVVDRD